MHISKTNHCVSNSCIAIFDMHELEHTCSYDLRRHSLSLFFLKKLTKVFCLPHFGKEIENVCRLTNILFCINPMLFYTMFNFVEPMLPSKIFMNECNRFKVMNAL